MDTLFADLGPALAGMFAPSMLGLVVLGTIFGVIVGALPGLTSTMGVALLVPVTFGMPAEQGLALLGAIYCSSTYSGSISAILLNIPGTPSNCCTLLDGYPMTRQGEGARALALSTSASAVGGLVSVAALIFLAPPLARLALEFGPQEYFVMSLFGVSVIATLSENNIVKGLMSGVLGLFLSIVGMHPLTGEVRFTFDLPELFNGLPLVTTLIGLYSIPEVVTMLTVGPGASGATALRGSVTSRLLEVFKYKMLMFRASIIGIVVGIVPGAGQSIASFIAYDDARRVSRQPELFGKGSPEGVIASETSNNAVVGGSLIPALTLGVPGNAVSAVLLGGLMIHGLNPGPTLFTEHAPVVYGFMGSLIISNLVFIPVGLFAARYCVRLIETPPAILAPLVMALAVVGSYAINTSMVDVWIMAAVGLMGCAMKLVDMPREPMVLGLVLGTMAEGELARALSLVQGNVGLFLVNVFTSPICLVMIALSLLTLGRSVQRARQNKKAA